MAQPVDWVGPFIENELRAVIAWKQKVKTAKARDDLHSRFGDDGSNFSSEIVPSDLPDEPRLQVSKVSSVNDPVTLVVTDGFTRVKARLSDAAVAVLETEMDEKIDVEMKGDVFSIRQASVISTPMGPSDEHVQLAIKDLAYTYHLRKIVGQPKPIQEREKVVRLLGEITRLRHQQYAVAEDRHESSPDPLSVDTVAGAAHNEQQHTRNVNNTPRSQRTIPQHHSSPPVASQQSSTTQPTIATQVPNRRRPSGPTLLNDGFEIEDGANLDRPVQGGFGVSTRTSSPPSAGPYQSAAPTDSNGKLLSLLRKRKAEALAKSSPPSRAPKLAETHARPHVQASRKELPQASQPDVQAEPVNTRRNSLLLTDPPHSPQARTFPSSLEGHEKSGYTDVPKPQAELGRAPWSEQAISHHAISSGTAPRDCTRRRVPRDQQRLLENASSWLPSLPGQQFPQPNIPIELLTRWNAQVLESAGKQAQPDATTVEIEPTNEQPDHLAAGSPMDASDSSSSETSSEYEEFTASQWPPSNPVSPQQARPNLPPDSTMGSNPKPSPVQSKAYAYRPPSSSNGNSSRPASAQAGQDKHSFGGSSNSATRPLSAHGRQEARAPNSSNEGASRRPSTPRTQHVVPSSNINASPGAAHPLPKRPDWIANGNAVPRVSSAPRSQASVSPAIRPNRRTTNPSQSQNISTPTHSSQTRMNGPLGSSPHQSPLPSQRSERAFQYQGTALSTPKNLPMTNERNELPLGTTPTSVVKATQLNCEDHEEDEMDIEMSVPQPLEQDPALAHRKKRSKFFCDAQRRLWLKQTYTPDPTTTHFSFAAIYCSYKSSHPQDAVKPTDFAEAIKAVFPSLYNANDESVAGLKLCFAENDAQQPPPEDGDARLNAIEAERQKMAHLLAKKAETAGSPANRTSKENHARESEQIKALKVYLAKLDAEAKSLGIEPDAPTNTYTSFQDNSGFSRPAPEGTGQPPSSNYVNGAAETPESRHPSGAARLMKDGSAPFPEELYGYASRGRTSESGERGQMISSQFSGFKRPRSSNRSFNGTAERLTPGSGRKLPWTEASSTQNDGLNGRRGFSQVAVGKWNTPTPTKLPTNSSSYLQRSQTGSGKPTSKPQSVQPANVATRNTTTPSQPRPSAGAPLTSNTLAENTSSTDGPTAVPQSTFAEFARAWKSVRPGGAFATSEPEPKRAKRQLNVLSWDL